MNPCDDLSDSVSEEEEEELNDQIQREPEDYANRDADDLSKLNCPPVIKDANPEDDEPIQHDENLIKDIAQFDNYKKEVYNHPLFPLLALLLEKCEIAAATFGVNEEPFASGDAFISELKAVIQTQTEDDKKILGKNPEVDSLMIKAIQVLRIHLLELEKVQELCKDFCYRYITCLRTKMNSENLLRGTASLHGSFDNSSCSSSSSDECSSGPSNFSFNEPNNSVPTDFPTAIAQDLSKNNQQPQQSSANNSDKCKATENQPQDLGTNKPLNLTSRIDSGTEGDLSDEASNVAQKRNQKRGILPKQATSVMRSWLFQHIVHPYPTEDEKRAIAAQTNLTLLQVNNWFINARRRILQPMLDSANINNSNVNDNDVTIYQATSNETNALKKLKTSNGNKNNTILQKSLPNSVNNSIKVASSTKETKKKCSS
ncbi:homeobox protein PKNOX2-like [Tetranychus urticae]|uniref:Homeobox domain-containing protein n=1 Tax=Tetranychus urticae TaxID=32264 RepID=T1KXT2_TETUR|nr:homeobox protein PKNOX2-like [Tetranychus urticae]